MNRTALTCTSIAALALVSSAALVAGPLNPPAGPVASTYKTLVEVEPRIAINAANTPGDANSIFRIIKPGSYYLTGNIVASEPGKHGIEIAASHVSVDLMGHALTGVTLAADGIHADAFPDNLTCHCGSITGWGGDGIDLPGGIGTSTIIQSVIASTARSNTSWGIGTSSSCSVIDCNAGSNTEDGIRCAGSGSLIRGNVCATNGINTGDGAGIVVVSVDNRIEGNTCTGNDRGIDVDQPGNIIIKNTCSGNTVNWTIVAGNAYGPIVATPAGAAVNGNTAAAALGSTDPNANFTF